jgi:hypothetical protein
MRTLGRIVGLGIAAVALVAPARARAGSGAAWWVEAAGACEGQRGALAHELLLACEAFGGTCHVARTRDEAELVARLECESNDAPWTLETRTVQGTFLGRLDLDGAREDRLREAAVEVARDVAPERTLVAAALRDTLPDADADAAPKPKPANASVTMAVGARGSMPIEGSATGGGGAVLGLGVTGKVHVTVSIAGELGGTGYDATRTVQGGAGFAVGAPFDRASIVGARFELGMRSRESYTLTNSGAASVDTQTLLYPLAGVYVQWPGSWIRPYAGQTFLVGAPFTLSAELGVSVDLF